MAKKKGRAHIPMECSGCKERNYWTEKNKATTTARLELKKYCNRCRKVTAHKEGK